MDHGTRACLAYVAGCVISGTTYHHIFDTARDLHISMMGTIKGTTVEIMDCDRECKFMGTLPTLFDFGTNTALSLEISGKNFSGTDKTSGMYFTGMIQGSQVKLYDYAQSREFLYDL